MNRGEIEAGRAVTKVLSTEEYEKLRRHWEEAMDIHIRDQRIRSIEINSAYQWQPKLHVEVGKYCANMWKDAPPELVVAIFESRVFLVCTPDHGAERGAPHIFTRDDVRKVIPWE
jgi:hypothetical protein